MSAEPRFWSTDDSEEILSHDCIEDAVDEWADKRFPEKLPETVEVFGFDQMDMPSAKSIADYLCGCLVEWSAIEDLGSPEEPEEILSAPEIAAAALVFAEAVRQNARVWACKKVRTETVRVADYVDLAEYARNVAEDAARRAPVASGGAE